MIKVTLSNDILKKISAIDENRFLLGTIELPQVTKNRLRKNSKKKSSYASNKIEGNPLTEEQANEAMERDAHKHLLKPEQEVRNYFLALNSLEKKLQAKEPFSKKCCSMFRQWLKKAHQKKKSGSEVRCRPGYCSLCMIRKQEHPNIFRPNNRYSETS